MDYANIPSAKGFINGQTECLSVTVSQNPSGLTDISGATAKITFQSNETTGIWSGTYDSEQYKSYVTKYAEDNKIPYIEADNCIKSHNHKINTDWEEYDEVCDPPATEPTPTGK